MDWRQWTGRLNHLAQSSKNIRICENVFTFSVSLLTFKHQSQVHLAKKLLHLLHRCPWTDQQAAMKVKVKEKVVYFTKSASTCIGEHQGCDRERFHPPFIYLFLNVLINEMLGTYPGWGKVIKAKTSWFLALAPWVIVLRGSLCVREMVKGLRCRSTVTHEACFTHTCRNLLKR